MQAHHELSRRERQIMDVLHRRGAVSAAEVRVLEEKGRITHQEVGRTDVYRPTTSAAAARRAALKHLVTTYFGGSVEEAAAALLDLPGEKLDAATRRRMARRIAEAEREGR
jgi:predicted transcriptional regulator